jgi:hypothetical protein
VMDEPTTGMQQQRSTGGVRGYAFADHPCGAVDHRKVLGIMHPITLIKGKTQSGLLAESVPFHLTNGFYLKITNVRFII